jgi:hypothetical protein
MLKKALALSQPSTNLDKGVNALLAKPVNFGGMLCEGVPLRGKGKGRGANLICKYIAFRQKVSTMRRRTGLDLLHNRQHRWLW